MDRYAIIVHAYFCFTNAESRCASRINNWEPDLNNIALRS
jgi:hypothetical protein